MLPGGLLRGGPLSRLALCGWGHVLRLLLHPRFLLRTSGVGSVQGARLRDTVADLAASLSVPGCSRAP